jgi:hypothetical protein
LIGDSQEPALEALQPAAGFLVRESTPVHFQEVACGRDCPADARGIGAGGAVGNRENGHAMRLGCMLAGGVELAL